MYSFTNFEPVRCSMSNSNYCFLICIQVLWEAGKVVWYSHLFQNFPVSCDPHDQRLSCSQWSISRCFSEIPLLFQWSSRCWQFDLWFLCLSKSSLYIWKFLVHMLLTSLEFSWQELCSGLPFPPAGDLPNPGTELIACWFFYLWATEEALRVILNEIKS